MSRAGLGRIAPRATPVLLLAANAPDVDVVTWPGGQLLYLGCHRNLTHALLLVPVMALLPVLLVRLIGRKPLPLARAYLVSLIGVASHPLLDLTNAYGIRLALPFSSHWYRLDIAHLFDVWILAILSLAAFAPLLSRLVSGEIGGKPSSGRGWAIFALLFVTAWYFGRYELHERAVEVLESRVYPNGAARRVAAIPGPGNPFHWKGIVEGDDFWSIHDVNLLGEFDPTLGRVFFKPPSSPALEAARRTPVFQEYLKFAQYPLFQVTPADRPEGAVQVQAHDLRFGSPGNFHFTATAVIGAGGEVVESSFAF